MPTWTVDSSLALDLDELHALRVRTVAGSVNVLGGAGDHPRLEITGVEGDPLLVRYEAGELEVAYEDLSWPGLMSWIKRRSWGRTAHVAVVVPASCAVELGVVSASAIVSRVTAPVSVRGVKGELALTGLAGPVVAETVASPVFAENLGGSVQMQSVAGDLTVAGAGGTVRASTTSGAITVDLDGADLPDLDLNSVTGEVVVRLPHDPDATIELRSVSGRVDCAFPEIAGSTLPGLRRSAGRLGNGTGRLRVESVSGHITLLRRSDTEREEAR